MAFTLHPNMEKGRTAAHEIEKDRLGGLFHKTAGRVPAFLYGKAILCAACGAQISRPGRIRALRAVRPSRWQDTLYLASEREA